MENNRTSSATLKADQNVLDIIRRATIDDDGLTLTGTLDRKDYVAVNQFLELAGAKWDRKAKRHVFQAGAKAKIEGLLGTGEILDEKKHFQAFYTPQEVAQDLVRMADVEPGMACLEPSAGDGAIAQALQEFGAKVTCIELNPEAAQKLEERGFDPLVTDFLTVEPEEVYDRVVMNPPFTRDQDIDHVLHAFKFLKPGGKLVAIMARGFLFGEQKKRSAFRSKVVDIGRLLTELPEGTFKESGTMVATVVIELRK